jgi:hypothetical protein
MDKSIDMIVDNFTTNWTNLIIFFLEVVINYTKLYYTA